MPADIHVGEIPYAPFEHDVLLEIIETMEKMKGMFSIDLHYCPDMNTRASEEGRSQALYQLNHRSVN